MPTRGIPSLGLERSHCNALGRSVQGGTGQNTLQQGLALGFCLKFLKILSDERKVPKSWVPGCPSTGRTSAGILLFAFLVGSQGFRARTMACFGSAAVSVCIFLQVVGAPYAILCPLGLALRRPFGLGCSLYESLIPTCEAARLQS